MKKRALVLQDFTAYTKASINISLPVLESLDIDTAVLPLSLLATQSDGFDDRKRNNSTIKGTLLLWSG